MFENFIFRISETSNFRNAKAYPLSPHLLNSRKYQRMVRQFKIFENFIFRIPKTSNFRNAKVYPLSPHLPESRKYQRTVRQSKIFENFILQIPKTSNFQNAKAYPLSPHLFRSRKYQRLARQSEIIENFTISCKQKKKGKKESEKSCHKLNTAHTLVYKIPYAYNGIGMYSTQRVPLHCMYNRPN